MRVVVDSHFHTPPSARLLPGPGRTLVVGARDNLERMAALRAAGAEVLLLPGASGQVDLLSLIDRLAADGVNELHVEAGATLNGALLATGRVDELLVYLAPKLIGPGRDFASLPLLNSLAQAFPMRFEEVRSLGDDLCLRARRIGADNFLD